MQIGQNQIVVFLDLQQAMEPSEYFPEIHELLLKLLVQHKLSKIVGDDTDLPIIRVEDQEWIVNNWMPLAAAGLNAAASKRGYARQ